MKAKDIVREACGIIGLPRPNTIVGSQDKGVVTLLGLLNKEGRELSGRHDWEILIRECEHTTIASEDQGPITNIIGATNNYRRILNETMWNRTRGEPVLGPESSIDWQLLKTLNLTGPFPTYRIRGGRLLITPAPSAGEKIYFEYVTRNWVRSGEQQARSVTKDEDELLLDDEIVLAGIEWRWRKSKGLQYAEDFNAYERMVLDAKSRDGTNRRISLADRVSARERRIAVPAGSWPL